MTPSRTPQTQPVRIVAVATAAALALAACSGGGAQSTAEGGGGGGGGDNSGYTFAMITHETPGDTFWDKIKAGAQQAAKDTGSTLKYSNDPDADQAGHPDPERRRLQGRRHRHHAGHPGRPHPDVKKAVAAGIPVDTFNSGIDYFQQAGSLAHFASDEKLAGQQAGKRAAARAPRRSSAPSSSRVGRAGGPLRRRQGLVPQHGEHPGQRRRRLRGHLRHPGQADPGQVHQLDHHPRRPPGPRRGQGTARRGVKAKIGTFDTNADAAQAVKDGKIQFFIDQQPYLQGYLAITQLYLYKKNGNIIGGGQAVLTGPSFVDKTNIAQILPFVKQNTR